MSTFKLQKPITTVTGNIIDTLEFDWESLSLSDLKSANKLSNMISDAQMGQVDNSVASPRLDPNLRIAIAWLAAMKGTKGLTLNDALQLSLIDALCLSEECLGSYFFR